MSNLLQLWNPKTDLEGGYQHPRNGLVFYDSYAIYHDFLITQKIAECAYYLWLNGSEDTEKNWLDAENFILGVDTNQINNDNNSRS